MLNTVIALRVSCFDRHHVRISARKLSSLGFSNFSQCDASVSLKTPR
jgi:hypothetical protein